MSNLTNLAFVGCVAAYYTARFFKKRFPMFARWNFFILAVVAYVIETGAAGFVVGFATH